MELVAKVLVIACWLQVGARLHGQSKLLTDLNKQSDLLVDLPTNGIFLTSSSGVKKTLNNNSAYAGQRPPPRICHFADPLEMVRLF